MSTPQKPKPARLVIGMFMKDKDLFEPIVEQLIEKYGNIDMISKWFDFDFTDYYKPEMGGPLFRRMVTFQKLIDQTELVNVKLFTNDIEKKHSIKSQRCINIDPGYLVSERFILATGKNFTHRIYLDKGIYADLTLIYQKGNFQTLPWTYPDYAHKNMLCFLDKVRKKYHIALKSIYCLK